jgi:hypothetical protein
MALIALVLHRSGQRPGTDLMMKFLEHFAAIRDALDGLGLWDEDDGIYYDRLITPDGNAIPVKVRSVAGMIPALALGVVDQASFERSMAMGKRFAGLLADQDGAGPDGFGQNGAAPGPQTGGLRRGQPRQGRGHGRPPGAAAGLEAISGPGPPAGARGEPSPAAAAEPIYRPGRLQGC